MRPKWRRKDERGAGGRRTTREDSTRWAPGEETKSLLQGAGALLQLRIRLIAAHAEAALSCWMN